MFCQLHSTRRQIWYDSCRKCVSSFKFAINCGGRLLILFSHFISLFPVYDNAKEKRSCRAFDMRPKHLSFFGSPFLGRIFENTNIHISCCAYQTLSWIFCKIKFENGTKRSCSLFTSVKKKNRRLSWPFFSPPQLLNIDNHILIHNMTWIIYT